ncbi:hypothetical protein [Paenimyroides baculatum]|uniref:Uncharacterized protein n=1 Tax=Paenimyroides baculatum TaxID=2608000 RepID=A0A5M6CEA4_9FLAO|nr:hypothetical protein [Paenimyroides baculatum]KAA5532780.1 hypothetical protein F0460_13120 [Paenimyroides baculatum]
MKTFLKDTSPAEAYKMFTDTFSEEILPIMLDEAFVHFTNYSSSLGSKIIEEISVYANQKQTPEFLDALAICHLFNSPKILTDLLATTKLRLAYHEYKIKHTCHLRNNKIITDNKHMYFGYTKTILKHQQLAKKAKQDIHIIESMILLITELKN